LLTAVERTVLEKAEQLDEDLLPHHQSVLEQALRDDDQAAL
jgi:hypothetical protein